MYCYLKQILIITLLFIFKTQSFSQTSSVRHDGIYKFSKDGINYNLRFYSDGTVLAVSIEDEHFETESNWNQYFDYRNDKYEIKENKISFRDTRGGGTVVYEGIIETESKLKLKTKSLINGYESEKNYLFIKF